LRGRTSSTSTPTGGPQPYLRKAIEADLGSIEGDIVRMLADVAGFGNGQASEG
jgi:hypothetical protein